MSLDLASVEPVFSEEIMSQTRLSSMRDVNRNEYLTADGNIVPNGLPMGRGL